MEILIPSLISALALGHLAALHLPGQWITF